MNTAPTGPLFQDHKMTSLALREQVLLACVLAAVIVGAAVKHWRDARREIPSAAVTQPPSASVVP